MTMIDPWALEEAYRRADNTNDTWAKSETEKAIFALAQMIVKHEKKPIDPLVVRAREICSEVFKCPDHNIYSDSPAFKAVLLALKDTHTND